MGVFDSLETTSKDAFSSGEDYLKTSRKYYELKLFKQLAFASSSLVKGLLIGSFLFLAILFATIALAFFLGEYFQNLGQGFLLTGLLLLILALIFFLMRHKLERRILHKLSKTYFDEA